MIRINGKQQDNITVQDRGLAYGDGLFETIAVLDGQPRLWAAHMARLETGCQRLAIAFPGQDMLASELAALEKKEKSVVKIIITRGTGLRGYACAGSKDHTIVVIQSDWPEFTGDPPQNGVSARICKLRMATQPALAGIKHLNRLEQVLARAEWNDETIAEGLMLDNNDHVIEGTMSNIFLVKHGELLTPRLDRCGVCGVQRNHVMTVAKNTGITVHESDIPLAQLRDAEEIFLSNSIIGLWPVVRIVGHAGKHEYPVGTITRKLQRLIVSAGNEI